MSSLLEKTEQKKFLKKLLAWYKKEGRHDMPWRKTKSAYAIFVSEFMLQQTTVATVRPYYARFLKKFPTLESLAKSDLNDVLSLWSGLGYYARARNLWASMKTIYENHKGKIPKNPEELVKLPGVGFYTAGAITTLAFNKPAPVLDGNIIRVLLRIFSIDDDPKLKAVQVLLRKTGMDLTSISLKNKSAVGKNGKGGPRDVVLALMDLGATLCAPKNPQCLLCPVSSFCLAKKMGRQDEIPAPKEKLQRPTIRQLYGVIEHKGKWLVAQRPKSGLFGGLWEFPGVEAPGGENPVLFLEKAIEEETGLKVRVKEAIPAFEHQLSHKVMINRSFKCSIFPSAKAGKINKKGTDYERFRWVSVAQLKRLGISAITKRILAHTFHKQPS